MHFWRIEQLKTTLKQRSLTTAELLPYVVAVCLASAVVTEGLTYSAKSSVNVWDYVFSFASVVLAALGTVYVYRLNGGPEGRDFLERYVVIGWVVVVRWLSAVLGISLVSGIVAAAFGFSVPEETSWQHVVVYVLGELSLYWLVGKHVRDVASSGNDQRVG